MTYRCLIATLAALTLASCTTPSSTEATDDDVAAATQDEESSSKTKTEDAPGTFSAPALDGEPAAVRVDYFGGGFRITREDGSFSTWTRGGEASEQASLRGTQIPVAWSPGGSLAMLDGSPPVIVRLSDGKEVLRFVEVEAIETAGFFPDGSGLYVGEASGALHVWNESEKTLTSVPTDNLEAFMARQSPSFSANFSSLSGEATITADKKLLLGTSSGKLYWWDSDNPGEVKTLVKLPGAVRDTAYAGGKVYATTDAGDFRGADRSSGVFLEWSGDVRADLVAAASQRPTHLLIADDTTIRLVDARDGTEFWSKSLGDGSTLCGLAFSDDGTTGAVCIDGGVVTFDADSGDALATLP
jgi:outer membrane protein assembly factor BamB